jgi:hypothetical protein
LFTGVAGSNLARGTDVCLLVSVLRCPVEVETTCPKESYQVIRLRNLRCEAAKVLTRTIEPLMMMKMMVSEVLFSRHCVGLFCVLNEERKCTRFWWEGPKERDHLEDQGVGGKMGLEWILGRLAWGVCIGLDLLRTGTGGGLL